MYARTLFRGEKTCKIGKKGIFFSFFGHIDKFCKGHDGQIKKNACKNAYSGSIFIPEKYAFRVCFESPLPRMISSLKYTWSPGSILSFHVEFICTASLNYSCGEAVKKVRSTQRRLVK